MCGRYVLEFDHDLYVGGRKVGTDIYNFNVAPTTTVPILIDRINPESIDQESGTIDSGSDTSNINREIHAARWGLLPSWAKDASFSSRAFNARSETVFEKPTFRNAAVNGHCAIPVTGYYEWKTQETAAGKKQKSPYFIHRNDGKPIYFAGLYEWWKITKAESENPRSPYTGQEGQWLLSCSIITMDSPDEFAIAELSAEGLDDAPAMQLSQLHDRLPVPLHFDGSENDALTQWLRSGRIAGEMNVPSAGMLTVSARESLHDIMTNAYRQTTQWTMHPVSNAVGNVRNNGPELIEPVEDLLSGMH